MAKKSTAKKKDKSLTTQATDNLENNTEEVSVSDDEVEVVSETEQTELPVETDDTDDNSTRLPPNVVEVKGRPWLKYVITAAVLAVFTLLVGWARGGFTAADTTSLLLGRWSDAFSVPGLLGVCFGLLVLASNGGAFDMLAYGFRRLFALFKKDPIDRKYSTFYDYQQARRSHKRTFWYMVIVGGAYLLVGIVLLVISLKLKQ